MKIRRLQSLAAAAVVALALASGCEDGAMGPQGPMGVDGNPHAIKVLLAGATSDLNMREMVVIAYRDHMFPPGSTVHYVNLRDSVPALATFKQYDAILVWSINLMLDPVATGNRLADYADAGGGVVVAQFGLSEHAVPGAAKGPLRGRIMTQGYCPLTIGLVTGGNNPTNKQIAVSSLGFPLHPIFNFVNDGAINYFSQSDFSDPGVDPTATLLAKDTTGDNALAINAKGNIIGCNLYGGYDFQDNAVGAPPFPEGNRLLANCLIWVAGAY